MHARLDQLLSLRDGAPVAAETREHVRGCAECARQLATTSELRDRLRALPGVPEPAADAWASIERRVAGVRHRRRRIARLGRLAAAASVVALAVFAAMRWTEPGTVVRQTTAAASATATASDREEELAVLQAHSQVLEEVLAALPARPAVERAATSMPIDTLEAQVQWLDQQLTLAGADGRVPQEQQLWRDRVEVMNSLVQLRYVEAQQLLN
jgi:hypothetical protein